MKEKVKKIIALVLTFLMSIGCVQSYPMVSALESDYEVYPNPHMMEYQDGSFDITSNVNIVYEDGIDEYTRDRLNEVLAIKKINATTSTEVKEDQTNILVGIKGSNQYVDQYAGEHYTVKTSNLFDQLDSYLLKVDNGKITVLGKDTDAAFYGLTSLYHIFKQLDGTNIRNFTMEDYANVASRGFIEGYYGNPWSTTDRIKLMEWGGYYKLNSYFYAPKDDPKHNSKWRELYTNEEIETKIKPLAEAGNKSKCRFVFALHPYMYDAIRYNSEENYQNDLKVLQAKFEQVIQAGVRQIAILADDAGNVGGENYTRTLTDMTAWLKKMQKTYPDLKLTLPFCTQEYMYNGQGYYRNFPENIQIVMTGGRVWGEVTNDFTTTFTNNVGRGPYMWINWPCTDNSKKHLIMGGYTTFLHPGVDPNKIQGIVLNPMQQSEPSKVAIFGNACYSWNIWQSEEEAQKCWNASFKYVDHNSALETKASAALRELSKHMINQNMDGRVTALQESVDLKDRLASFKEAISNGTTISDEQFKDLINEFTILKNASTTYREQAGDSRVKDQIVYWLNCWDDTTDAAINYIKAIKAAQDGDANDKIWDLYAAGQAAFEKSKTYGFNYVDHLEYAEVGVQHIVPFIKTMDSYLGDIASTIVDPNKQVIKFITNRNDMPTGNTDYVFDNKVNTEIVYKTPNSISKGTYVGVTYTKAIDIDKVTFKLGTNANPNDTFSKAKVQYTTDGKKWVDLNDQEYTLPKDVVLTDLGLKSVRGIRMIATEAKSNTWLGVRDIVINAQEVAEEEKDAGTLSTDKLTLKSGSLNDLLDDSEDTYAHFAESPYKGGEIKDYLPKDASITLTFNKEKTLRTIHFAQDAGNDKSTKYVIEYTTDGQNWTAIQEYNGDASVELDVTSQNIKAKAIRIRNLELHLQDSESSGYWWKVKTFKMDDSGQINATFMYTDAWGIYEGTVANLTDDDDSTDVEFRTSGDITRKGDYIGWDLGKETAIGKIHAAIGGKRDAGNKWKKYSLQYSNDNKNWTTYKTYQGVSSGKDTIDENFNGLEARYVRLVNEEEKHVWVIFSEFSVKPYNPDEEFDNTNVYTNTDYKLASQSEEALTELIYNQEISLEKSKYVGVDLLRIKDLSTFNIDYENGKGLTLQVSKNGVEWTTITNQDGELPDGRYVRLINKTDHAIKLTINRFEVHSNEVTAPSLYETTMNINSSWGVAEDTRNNGAAFDGNIDTTTEFGDFPKQGQYIIYDLGQERIISKIQMYCQDSAVNYIRDADILVSDDLKNWTKVVTIGDGIENTNDGDVKCIDSDAGYKASSTYPNKVYVEGTANQVKARYLKILMTASNNKRAVLFNEIVINDGEYVPVTNDPAYTSTTIEARGYIPQYLFDGDLSTAYKPGTKEAGSITYTLSSNLDVKKMHIIQKGEISNARVSVLVDDLDTKTRTTHKKWVQVGTLRKSLNEFYMPDGNIYELKIEWDENHIPTISETIMLNEDEYVSTATKDLQDYIDTLDVKESTFTANSYKEFKTKLKQANKVIDENYGELDLVVQAKSKLEIAYASLVKRGDIQSVKDELDAIDQLKENDYTSETWATLQQQVQTVNDTLAKGEANITEKDVEDMVEALQKAKAQLVTKVTVSKEVLKNYIESNELDKLDTDQYLTSTVSTYKQALKNAQALLAQEATKEQLDEALKQLQNARAQLVLKATDNEINVLKTIMAQYQEKDYTASTWKEFEKAYNDIKKSLENENSSDDINSLTVALEKASQKLVKRGDLNGIHDLLDQIKQLDSKKYTDASYSKLLNAVTEISKKLENSSEMTQEEADVLANELQNAIDSLEKAPTVSTDTKNEPIQKPQVITTKETNKVKTGDQTSIWTFMTIAFISVIAYIVLNKKIKENN